MDFTFENTPLTWSKLVADRPADWSEDDLRRALAYLESTRSNGGVRNSERAMAKLERRLERLNEALATRHTA